VFRLRVGVETLRQWMMAAGLFPRSQWQSTFHGSAIQEGRGLPMSLQTCEYRRSVNWD
jgi:hypothetical protein